MKVHEQFRAAIIAEARKLQPQASAAQLDAIVAKVVASPGFASCADFLTDDLRRLTFADADFQGVVKIAATPAPAPVSNTAPADVRRPKNPTDWLGQHYEREAGERPDIESAALSARVRSADASPLDKLRHARANPAAAEKEASVNTMGLEKITDPTRRLEEYRLRADRQKTHSTLLRQKTAAEAVALDPGQDANTRAQANIRLKEIEQRLAAFA